MESWENQPRSKREEKDHASPGRFLMAQETRALQGELLRGWGLAPVGGEGRAGRRTATCWPVTLGGMLLLPSGVDGGGRQGRRWPAEVTGRPLLA